MKYYLLGLLCFFFNSVSAEYQLIYTAVDGTQFFANLDDKQIKGDIVTVREFQNYPNKNIQGDSSMFSETEYDCPRRKSRHIRLARFGGRNLTGSVNDRWFNIRNEWKSISENTIGSLIFHNVCKRNV